MMVFPSGWAQAKTVVCIVSTRQSVTDGRTHSLTEPHRNGRITISPPTVTHGDDNEHKLCKAFDQLFKIRNTLKLCTRLWLTMLAYCTTSSHVPRRRLDPGAYRSRGERSTTEPWTPMYGNQNNFQKNKSCPSRVSNRVHLARNPAIQH